MRSTDWQEGARAEGRPAGQAEPPSLAGKSGGAGRTVFRQPARLSVWEVRSEQLCTESGKAGGQREGELLSPETTELFGREQRRSPAPSPCPSPSQNPKGNQFLPGNLLAPRKHPTLCFCGATPPAVGLTPYRCHRFPPEVDHLRRSELSLPLLPPCTMPTNPS